MKHVQYPSITNHYQGKFIDKIRLEFPKEVNEPIWTVTEKVHGSNYAFYIDYYVASHSAYIKAAKRTDFIYKGEEFFSHNEVFDRLSPAVYAMSKDDRIKQDCIVFGELYGGTYNGYSKDKIVQRGVQYAMKNDFAVFDIAIYDGTKDRERPTITFMSHDDVIRLCKQYKVPHVPVLFEGTLDECLAFNNEFITKIPERYGAKPIEGNLSEGTIIKPKFSLFLKSGERVILKNKNEKFKETQKIPKGKHVPSVFNNHTIAIIGKITAGLTENRMDGIISKNGEGLQFGHAMRELLLDAVNDTCKDEYYKLSGDEQHVINKFLNKELASIVRKRLIFNKKVG